MPLKDGVVVRICRGPSCAHAAPRLEAAARAHIAKRKLDEEIQVEHECCFGRCSMAPNIVFERWRDGSRNEKAMLSLIMNLFHPDMQPEHGVRPAEVPRLIDAHHRAWRRNRERSS